MKNNIVLLWYDLNIIFRASFLNFSEENLVQKVWFVGLKSKEVVLCFFLIRVNSFLKVINKYNYKKYNHFFWKCKFFFRFESFSHTGCGNRMCQWKKVSSECWIFVEYYIVYLLFFTKDFLIRCILCVNQISIFKIIIVCNFF